MSFLDRVSNKARSTFEEIKNDPARAALAVGTAGASEQAYAAGDLLEEASKKASDYDPTKVRKTDVSGVQAATEQLGTQAQDFLNRDVPLVQTSDIQAQTVGSDWAGRDALTQALEAATANVGAAGQIDPAVADFIRSSLQQNQLDPAYQLAMQAATGQAPSQAQSQLQQGVDQSIAAQFAAAASGGGGPAALRGAQNQAAAIQQNAANQAAQLRAQEMAQARALFGDIAGMQQAQNIEALQQAAGLTLSSEELAKGATQAAIDSALGGSQALSAQGLQAGTADADRLLKAVLAEEANRLTARDLQQRGELGFAGLGAELLGQQMGGEQFMAGLESGRLNQIADLRGKAFGAGMDTLSALLVQAMQSGGKGAGMAATGGASGAV